MIILHGGILERRFFLWGETPAGEQPPLTAKRGRKPKGSQPAMYRFDAGGEGLLQTLLDAAIGFNVSLKNIQKLTVWLPTSEDGPIASSPLIAELPAEQTGLKFAPWGISGHPLAPGETLVFLCLCAGKQTLAAGVVLGADLAYWAAVLRWAGSLAARQQFLPGIEVNGNTYKAQWQPIFSGDDIKRLAKLTQQMPSIARALTDVKVNTPPEASCESLLKQFVTEILDGLVRTACPVTSVISPKKVQKKSAFESVHDAWLHALRSSDGRIDCDQSELVQLTDQIRQWRRPIDLSMASPIRLCFRLEEPDMVEDAKSEKKKASAENWHVRFLLQPHKDPSLLVSVDEIWNDKGRKNFLKQHLDTNYQEYLLSALGQAAGVCPKIAESLKTTQPSGYSLETAQAHHFLTETALLLEQAGFGVMLPAWWTRQGTKTRLTTRAIVKSPKMQGGGGLSLDAIVDVEWEIALGGQTLSLKELQALAKLKAPLVRVRGQWVQMNTAEIQAAIDFWKKKGSQQATVQEIIQMALGVTNPAGGFVFEGVRATGWIEALLKQLEGSATLEPIAVPETFDGTLRPYQQRGYAWLAFLRQWGLGACLADDMGLGKTVQTLALIQREWHKDGKRPVLLVCPTSVVNNWQKEAARFTPDLPVMVHHGSDRNKGAAFKKLAQKHAIVISSYALLHRDMEFLQQVPWAGAILDEAQNIKNSETKQSQAARSLKVDYRIALTGTPVENNVGDLWSIMEFLNPGFLGTQAAFKRNFFIPIQAGRDPEAANQLKRITGPFILRRLKTDKSIISDLPDKQEMKVFCTLTHEQASLYAAVLKEVEEAMNSAEGIQRKGIILATLAKLKQVCNHPAQLLGDNSRIPGRSGKLARLTEMLEEILTVGDRALVFSQFAEMGEILRRHLQETFGREVLFLHGAVAKKKRDHMVEQFQSDNGPPLFVLSLKAGGTGLNLTRANHVFHFDRWWNPAVENQATDRAFRIGQTKNVQVHKFLCAGTLEDKIDAMIERKQEIAQNVVGAGEGWLTELSNEQLKDLFALRKEAIGD